MVKLTSHYIERYKQRVSKSKKNLQSMADKAFEFGTSLDDLDNISVKKVLKNSTRWELPYVKCKIYRGYVWWFSATTILTVYALPMIRASI